MLEKLDSIEQRYQEIERLLTDIAVSSDYERVQSLAQERASYQQVIALYRQYRKATSDYEDAKSLLDVRGDEGIAALAREEVSSLESQIQELDAQLRAALLPKDPYDEKNAIMEIRAAAGGEEASLFASDLYRMYTRYAAVKKWKVEVIDINDTGLGGIKEVVFQVRGKGAYSRLKHESGGHRVQRIPVTESSGRIHTSTATVAVLPEAEEVDVEINPNDLRIDIFHASGHGGQSVQKVATAVRITHIPTGVVATCQDERSQLHNKLRAMAVLRSRILDMEIQRKQAEVTASRRSQVGTGERSEKVRTYNFPQDRLTDHRINLTAHNLQGILDGGLGDIIDALIVDQQARSIQEAGV